jgi:hypothetical protein
MAVLNYFIRIGDALSQLLNVILFGGDSNHSISGDAWRFKRERLRRFLDFVFRPFEADHCYKAHLHDVRKAGRLLREWSDSHTL